MAGVVNSGRCEGIGRAGVKSRQGWLEFGHSICRKGSDSIRHQFYTVKLNLGFLLAYIVFMQAFLHTIKVFFTTHRGVYNFIGPPPAALEILSLWGLCQENLRLYEPQPRKLQNKDISLCESLVIEFFEALFNSQDSLC